MRVIISGAFGFMGRAVAARVAETEGAVTVCGVDIASGQAAFPVVDRIESFNGGADVIIDFSHHSQTAALCAYAVKRGIPLVVSTTGQTEAEKDCIAAAAEKIPVFMSGNMSLGVALLRKLCRKAAEVLEGADIEIIEKHHNRKLDAPSGTALMLAKAVQEVRTDCVPVYDRHSAHTPRRKNELGIHSVRAANIVGEHEVLFALPNEHITLSHSAFSRELFADGALKAALFLVGKSAGLYGMDELLG